MLISWLHFFSKSELVTGRNPARVLVGSGSFFVNSRDGPDRLGSGFGSGRVKRYSKLLRIGSGLKTLPPDPDSTRPDLTHEV